MGASRYLLRRGLRWYFRLHVPQELQPFLGRDELRKSLRTSCYPVAKEAMRSELFRAERLFTQIRGGLVTAAEAKKLIRNYFNRNLEDAEEARLEGVGLLRGDEDGEHEVTGTREGLELHLEGMIEDLASGDYRSIQPVADAILEEAEITLEKSSKDYQRILRETLKAAIAATRTELQRFHGQYEEEPGGASSRGTEAVSKVAGVLLSEAVNEYMKEHAGGGHWTNKTEVESRAIYDLFIGIVGDRDVSEVGFKELSEFRTALQRFPTNWKKRRAYRDLSIPEILQLEKVSEPFSPSNVNKFIIRTGAFLRWGVKREYFGANYAEGLTISKRGKRPDEERDPYSKEDLMRLVTSGLEQFRESRPERFWIPLTLGPYTGARLNELCQLHTEDVKEIDGILCLDITDKGGEGRRLKTASSRRTIPVPPIALQLGFHEYVEQLRKRGKKRLWKHLPRKRDGYGHHFSKWYQNWNRKHVSDHPKRVFHSFRANVATGLQRAGVEPNIIEEILGHARRGETHGRYAKGYSMQQLRDALEKLEYGTEEELKKLPRLDPVLVR